MAEHLQLLMICLVTTIKEPGCSCKQYLVFLIHVEFILVSVTHHLSTLHAHREAEAIAREQASMAAVAGAEDRRRELEAWESRTRKVRQAH